MAHILLIDDDAAFVPAQVRQAFPAPAHEVSIARDGASGLAHVKRHAPDVVLLDLRLPDGSGLDVHDEIRKVDARIPVIFITIAKSADTAIEAMKRGAFDYLFKPLNLEQLRTTVAGALDVARRMREPVVFGQSTPDGSAEDGLFGSCPAMLDVYKQIGRVAAQDVTVLITGESGTGKEVVARAIYQHSARATAPFIALNCAAIPENLLESELFGHERGAFTGADRRRIGKFEQCNGGTIFLDEIGDMSPALQAKFLRVLQEQTFERVGGNETIRTDVRVLAATHRDLEARAAEDKFRPDLFYRLGVFTIRLPPLRERAGDLTMLARHFVARFAQSLGRDVKEIAPEVIERLESYSWPGNVRELQSVIKQALLNARGSVLLPAFLPPLSLIDRPRSAPASSEPLGELATMIRQALPTTPGEVYARMHREVDRLLFILALQHTAGNHRDAARVLGISRQTMRVKLRALGLQVAHVVEEYNEELA